MSTILVVDIGGTSIKIGFVVHGEPQEFIRLFSTTELRTNPIAALERIISTAMTESGLHPAAIVSTVPGLLDAQHNRVLHAANIPELNGVLLATEPDHVRIAPAAGGLWRYAIPRRPRWERRPRGVKGASSMSL